MAFNTWSKPEDVCVICVDGSGLRQLTDDEHRDRFPRWSPDGKQLTFYSNRSGDYQIWTIAPDGSSLQQLTRFADGARVLQPVWSPEGARLAIVFADRPPRIMQAAKPWDESSLESLPLLESPETLPSVFSWSPDGRRLAGHRRLGVGTDRISIYSLDSRQYQHFPDPGGFPRWLRDSRRLIYSRGSSLYLLDTRSGKARELLSVAPNGLGGVALSPDDRRIYFGLNSVEADVWLMESR
jgi:Tol biopolymer transport system component